MTEEEFNLSIGIRPAEDQGVEQTVRQIQLIDKWCKAMGMSADDAQRHIQALLRHTNFHGKFSDASGNLTDLGKTVVSQYTQDKERRDQEERYRADTRNKRNTQVLSGIANPFSFISPKSGIQVQTLLNNIGRVIPQVQGLGVAFQAAKGAWDFADAIAELNTKILQLGYTSGLGAQKITDLGAAVAAFGGSAEKIASGNERFIMQIEKMKRGGGLGYLGDVAYKYGFSVDMNANWEQNNKAAIDYARQMMASGDKNGAMAFLKEWDSANYTSNMMKASMSKEHVAANDAFYQSYNDLGDAEKVTEETQKFNEESVKAQRAWTAITNQLASMMLPLMTKLTSFVTKIADYLAKSPGILKTLLTILGAVMGLVSALIVKQMFLTTLKIAGAIASGNWVGAAIAGAMIGIGVAGAAAMSSGVGAGNSRESIKSVAPEAVSVKDLVSKKETLTARERYSLNEMDKSAFGKSWDSEWKTDYLNESSVTLADVFQHVCVAANKMKDSMTDVASEAMSMQQAQNLATILSNSNNISNIANSNTSNVNVNISQNFNEADTSEIRAGVYDVGSEIVERISQASRRFNT